VAFTRESEYALLGLAVLGARPEGAVVSLAEIAAERDLPPAFLAKVFMKLSRNGLLISHRGRGKGYALARPAEAILVLEVLEAVEGIRLYNRCLLWEGHCHDTNPCPLHFRLQEVNAAFRRALDSVTLADYLGNSEHVRVRP